MNISSFAQSTCGGNKSSGSIYAGNLMMMKRPALKSTQDKMERQQKTQEQIDFFTDRKEKLKDMQCGTVEEIARKLEMLHGYEEQIAAIKKQYNGEQMFHVLDEARELGEKIAEAAEKNAPKTAEERKEEMVEEALGIDENKGMLDEMLEDAAQMQEALQDEVLEENLEELDETLLEETDLDAVSLEETIEESIEESVQENVGEITDLNVAVEKLAAEQHLSKEGQYLAMEEELKKMYKPLDILI